MHDRDWIMYGPCPTCGVETAAPCLDQRYRAAVPLLYPHDDRPTRPHADVRALTLELRTAGVL